MILTFRSTLFQWNQIRTFLSTTFVETNSENITLLHLFLHFFWRITNKSMINAAFKFEALRQWHTSMIAVGLALRLWVYKTKRQSSDVTIGLIGFSFRLGQGSDFACRPMASIIIKFVKLSIETNLEKPLVKSQIQFWSIEIDYVVNSN